MNSEIIFNKYKKRGAGYHWDQISSSLTRRNVYVVARYNIMLNQIGNCMEKRVLDIGCGDGALSYLISQKGAIVIGVDTSGEAIKFAKEKTCEHKNIDFIKASAYWLPFKSSVFDCTISADAIEHLQEPQCMLAEMKRVFTGKGKVIITTPLRFTENPLDKMHVQEFYESDFRRLVSHYFGFTIEIIKSHPVVFMELQNKHFLVKLLFNGLNLVFGFNPFSRTKGYRYYSMQTALISGISSKGRNKSYDSNKLHDDENPAVIDSRCNVDLP